ncbi:hypothetical protein C8J56DRAFT_896557 [Mycena floridula]|nr:hypothetical protein C8J56DRAFT_896557 [Mycena floridula]
MALEVYLLRAYHPDDPRSLSYNIAWRVLTGNLIPPFKLEFRSSTDFPPLCLIQIRAFCQKFWTLPAAQAGYFVRRSLPDCHRHGRQAFSKWVNSVLAPAIYRAVKPNVSSMSISMFHQCLVHGAFIDMDDGEC